MNPITVLDPDRGLTSVHAACCNDDVAALELLVRSGADINSRTILQRTPLYIAGRYSIDGVRLLIAAGVLLDVPTKHNITAAHNACGLVNVAFLQELVAVDADITLPDIHGRTPLDIARGQCSFGLPKRSAPTFITRSGKLAAQLLSHRGLIRHYDRASLAVHRAAAQKCVATLAAHTIKLMSARFPGSVHRTVGDLGLPLAVVQEMLQWAA